MAGGRVGGGRGGEEGRAGNARNPSNAAVFRSLDDAHCSAHCTAMCVLSLNNKRLCRQPRHRHSQRAKAGAGDRPSDNQLSISVASPVQPAA